jgi:predicted amidohydrolase YtcJ
MTAITRLSALALFISLTASCSEKVPLQSATHIYTNAKIYTVDAAQSRATEVGVLDKKIVCVGAVGACDSVRGSVTTVHDLAGKFVVPGFIDSHNHVSYSMGSNFLSLMNVASYGDFRAAIQAFSDENPDLEWIMGDGWNYSIFEGGMPTAKDLDGITNGRPAIFTSYDAHTQLLNTKGMELFGITAASKRSPLGEILRDEKGEPTGIFKAAIFISEADQAAMDAIFPEPDWEDIYQGFLGNLDLATSVGITTIVEPQMVTEDLESFERARNEGRLNAYIHLAMFHPPGTTAEEVSEYEKIRDHYSNDLEMKVPALKLYIDDVIEAETAALFEPYAGSIDNFGELFFEPKEFNTIITDLDARGFQLFIHAIGDRGINTALNALEIALATNGKPAAPHQIVHIELLQESDVARFAELDVSATIQPRHMLPWPVSQWQRSIGDARLKNAWPLQSMHEAGARFAFSSDWNVAEMDPLIGIYTAVTRQSLDGQPVGGWFPDQRIDVATAIRGYTLDAAISNGIGGLRGSIEIGKYADMVVLSEDLTNIELSEIKNVQVLQTIFSGEVIYSAE